MSLSADILPPAAMPSTGATDHVVAGDDAAVLGAILSPHVNLAIWMRRAAPDVPAGDDLDAVDDIALTIDPAHAVSAAGRALEAAGYGDMPALGRDIGMQAMRFANLVDCQRVGIRLDVIETDACRRFHADHVGLRLICTYAGPGTQWLSNGDAARLNDGAPVEALAVQAMSTGHVALFKGRDWSPERPIVHRSPPIAGTGIRRLVLVIDAAAEPVIPGG